MNKSKWISVKERLPEIKENERCSKPILVCTYDPIFDEDKNDKTKNRGIGLYVSTNITYGIVNYKTMPEFVGSKFKDGEPTFIEDVPYNGGGADGFMSPFGQITHWMYVPKPPKYNTSYNKEKDILEFVYL